MLAKACFVAGTPILTPYGHQPIESLSIGDRVWARPQDQPDAPPRVQVVEKTFHRTSAIVRLHVAERLIETTDAHPFFVVGRGWTSAGELHVGDLIASHRGDPTPVTFLERDPREQPVYNVRVSEDHTYFVGAADWPFTLWAHNWGDCGAQTGDAVEETIGSSTTGLNNPWFSGLTDEQRDALQSAIDDERVMVFTGAQKHVVEIREKDQPSHFVVSVDVWHEYHKTQDQLDEEKANAEAEKRFRDRRNQFLIDVFGGATSDHLATLSAKGLEAAMAQGLAKTYEIVTNLEPTGGLFGGKKEYNRKEIVLISLPAEDGRTKTDVIVYRPETDLGRFRQWAVACAVLWTLLDGTN